MKMGIYFLIITVLFYSCSGYKWTTVNYSERDLQKSSDYYLNVNSDIFKLNNLVQVDSGYVGELHTADILSMIPENSAAVFELYCDTIQLIKQGQYKPLSYYVANNNVIKVKYTEFDKELKTKRTIGFISLVFAGFIGLVIYSVSKQDIDLGIGGMTF